MSLLLLKEALFEKAEFRSQMLLTAASMLVAAALLAFVAWWLLGLGMAALADSAEYESNLGASRRRRGRGLGQALLLGFGAGGIVSCVTLILGLSGAFHLTRWIRGAGIDDRDE